MKRFIFSVCALAAVVVGCTKSEVINRPHAEEPIQFNPYTGRIPVTKGTAADIDSLGKYGFQVYAFIHGDEAVNYGVPNPYMNKIVKLDETGAWKYPGQAYWPGDKQLNFIAYGLNAAKKITQGNQLNEIKFSVSETVSTHEDLLVALVQQDLKHETNGETVNLVFSHLLSRIGFSLVTSDGNTVPVTIEQLNLDGKFYESGKVILSEFKRGTLTFDDAQKEADRPYIELEEGTVATDKVYQLLPQTYSASYTGTGDADGEPIFDNSLLYTKYTGDETVTDDDEYKENENVSDADQKQVTYNEKNRYMMIIPVKGSEHQAKLKVKYFLPYAGTFEEVTVSLADVDFEPGKSYNFKLKVSTKGIGFSVDVDPWDVTGEDRQSIILR